MTEEASKPPMIEADGLSKFYGIFTACRDVTFKVHEGEDRTKGVEGAEQTWVSAQSEGRIFSIILPEETELRSDNTLGSGGSVEISVVTV